MYRADKKFWISRLQCRLKSLLYVSSAYCDILIIFRSLARLRVADCICVLKCWDLLRCKNLKEVSSFFKILLFCSIYCLSLLFSLFYVICEVSNYSEGTKFY